MIQPYQSKHLQLVNIFSYLEYRTSFKLSEKGISLMVDTINQDNDNFCMFPLKELYVKS